MDVTQVEARTVVASVHLVQTVNGEYAVWIDGKETGLKVAIDNMRFNNAYVREVKLSIEAGRLELMA